jgi:hypothetical protein
MHYPNEGLIAIIKTEDDSWFGTHADYEKGTNVITDHSLICVDKNGPAGGTFVG